MLNENEIKVFGPETFTFGDGRDYEKYRNCKIGEKPEGIGSATIIAKIPRSGFRACISRQNPANCKPCIHYGWSNKLHCQFPDVTELLNMRDVEDGNQCSPEKISNKIPTMADTAYAQDLHSPTDVLYDATFHEEIRRKLSTDQVRYVDSLLSVTGSKGLTVGDIKKALSSGEPICDLKGRQIFDPKDPITPSNLAILNKIFLGS